MQDSVDHPARVRAEQRRSGLAPPGLTSVLSEAYLNNSPFTAPAAIVRCRPHPLWVDFRNLSDQYC